MTICGSYMKYIFYKDGTICLGIDHSCKISTGFSLASFFNLFSKHLMLMKQGQRAAVA
jgi:hypothetical protein